MTVGFRNIKIPPSDANDSSDRAKIRLSEPRAIGTPRKLTPKEKKKPTQAACFSVDILRIK